MEGIVRVEVYPRSEEYSRAASERLIARIHQAGATGITACISVRLFFLSGTVSSEHLHYIATYLLADPVVETYSLVQSAESDPLQATDHRIETTLLPGVTDPEADNLLKAIHQIGITGIKQVATGYAYALHGEATPNQLQHLATRMFANPVIQQMRIDGPVTAPFVPTQPTDDTVEMIALRNASDDDLLAVSKARRLALNLAEMQAIQAYFQQESRDPTDAELEMLAQTWSEHCVHKTFKALVNFTMADQREVDAEITESTEQINGILRTYIRSVTEKLNKPWVRSAFVDNAGVIAFNDSWDIAFKVETHNRPSALDPFGGAHTGVGGVVRDILGVSARP
ncbi:MAG: phosphoribosylformylglycinamidine synthase, partial [Chloroflexaceae bacterium]|nr:phosphoribosylformylglycinamidine synthase [Chloroflexaceae bacterium]